MALSDDLLGRPETRVAVRERVRRLVDALEARAGFLVDEDGAPFASVGQLDFSLPHPLAKLPGAAALLGALVGEDGGAEASRYLVEPAGERALLAVVFETPPSSRRGRRARKLVRECARDLAARLGSDVPPA